MVTVACGAVVCASLASAAPVAVAATAIPIVHVSDDSLTDSGPQHATEIESALAGDGSKVVGAYEVGRWSGGGSAAAVGFATSADGGSTWTHGLLPGITGETPADPGPYARVVDENVAYDAAHATWLIGSVAVDLVGSSYTEVAAAVSRSADGTTWSDPVTVDASGQPDKQWTTCDNSVASLHFGTCYMAYRSDTVGTGPIRVARSSDGGASWSTPVTTGIASGYNAQPIVRPDGTLVVVATDVGEHTLLATRSTDGGRTFAPPVTMAAMVHRKPDGLRVFFKPSVGMTSSGTVWVAWADCAFRTSCGRNDIVTASSADGTTWTAPARVPIEPMTSTIDHVTPVLAVDPASGTVGIKYDEIPNMPCGAASQPTCQVEAAFVSTTDGGAHWADRSTVGPAALGYQLPNTPQGFMPGNYEGLTYVGGVAIALFRIAAPRSGSTYDVSMNAALVSPAPPPSSDGAAAAGTSDGGTGSSAPGSQPASGTGPTPAGVGTTSPRLVQLLAPRTVRVRRGRFALQVRFAPEAPAGTARPTILAGRKQIGSMRLRVRPGHTVKVTFILTRSGLRKLEKAHKLKVTARIAVGATKAQRTLTLRG